MSTTPSPRAAQVKRRVRDQFDRWAGTYDRSWLNELVFFPTIRACQEEIRRWQAACGPRSFRMLDVGCGTGRLLTVIARDPQAELLVGVDYTREMVRRAAAKFSHADAAGRLHMLQGDAERLPIADASFDVLTCCNSFHHYPHQLSAAREFRRVLRPGGLLLLIDGFRDNVIGWVLFDVFVALIERHVHHCAWSEVRTMFRDAGFAEIRQRKLNVLAPLLITAAAI